MILDSIKHVSSHMSSVREVLPGREYFIPNTRDKENPLTVSEEEFTGHICKKPVNISKALYTSLTGMSPVMAEEICYRASIDGSDAAQSLDETACTHLYHTFLRLMEQIQNREFTPNIVYRGEEPVEYGVFPYQQFGSEYRSETFDSVSAMLETYYATKSLLTRIHQKSSDLRRVDQTLDRELIAKIVFENKEMLAKMNGIVHPAVKEYIKKAIKREEENETNIFIVEAALLIEDKYDEICDELWYIYADEETRMERLKQNRGYSEEKCRSIFRNQLSEEEFSDHCDFEIDNSDDFEKTKEKYSVQSKRFFDGL